MTLYENRQTAKSYSTVKPLQMASRIENQRIQRGECECARTLRHSLANRYSSIQYRVVLIVSVAIPIRQRRL